MSIAQTAAGRTDGFTASVSRWYWALILLAYGPSHAVRLWSIPEETSGPMGSVGWFIYLLVLSEMNDISQAFFGRHWGQRRIAPSVSPFKTWAGFIGGVVTTSILALVLAPWLTSFVSWGDELSDVDWLRLSYALAAGLLISISGFFGDINLSAVKRDAGVKDSGTLLPGQGGVLDRMDSLTFTAPVFYCFVLWFLN